MKEGVDRRKEKRFGPEEGCLAIMWPASSKAGHIVDMSLGGLAFRYVARSNSEGFASDIESDIEIICSSEDFSSGLLPVENVSDTKMERIFSDLIPMELRRHSIKFKQLNEEQKSLLKRFIQKHCLSLTE